MTVPFGAYGLYFALGTYLETMVVNCKIFSWLKKTLLSSMPSSVSFLVCLALIFKWYPTPKVFFMKLDDPIVRIWPLAIIPIRSARCSASSIWCVVKTMVLPSSCRTSSKIFQMILRDYGSNPLLGSSKNIIFDFPIKDMAREHFLLFPPDNCPTCLCFSKFKPHLAMTSAISSCNSGPYLPFISPMNFKCSSTVNFSYKTSFYKHNPKVYRISSKFESISWLFTMTFPPVFSINPVRRDIVVVFPAPLCPRRQNIWFPNRVREISSTAVMFGNFLDNF